MNKARRLLGTIFVSALLILIGIAASPDDCFAAEDDIASGTYDGVPWAITSDYTLQIGDGGDYTFTDNLSRNSESYPWYNQRTNIKSVEVLGTIHGGNGTLAGMFEDFKSCTSMTLSGFDTSNVRGMTDMFRNCSSLESLDLSTFDTTNVRAMGGMFCECTNLANLNISGFNTSNVTSMFCMFSQCSSLTNLDLPSGFNTSNVTNMGGMFQLCTGLTELNLSGFDTSSVTDMGSMFNFCESLTELNISNFNTSNVTGMEYMFCGCSGLRTLTTLDWSGSEAWLPEFPLKMKNTVTQEEYAAGTRFPAVASVTYEACEIIIDGDEETTVPKEAFEEIAGKEDMDLVIQGTDIQWTFHGSDVAPGSGKDIDVTTYIHKENGESVGFADDDQVLVIDFADNGKLPGAAEIQIINDYISAQKAGGIETLMLSYISGSQITLEDSGVQIEGKDTAVFKIDHNSRFTLSAHKAITSLRSATVIVSNCIYNGKTQKPSVTVRLNGRTLDQKYYQTPQYSANKAVGTATVRITGNSSFGYKGTATGTFYINPKKAAISKLKVGKKMITVKMKAKPASLGAAKYKIEYRIAGKGKWKSASTTGKSKVIKKLKKGKKYQVRVTAVKGARKGPVSATKKSKKIK